LGLLENSMAGQTRRNNHSYVVHELGKAIVSGELKSGSLLPNDAELSARFGVSRTVLRESMKTLAAKRLIEPKAKVGTRVLEETLWNFFDADVLGWRCEAGIDEKLIGEIAEIRLALEPAAAACAARRASDSEIDELRQLAARFNEVTHTRESIANVDLYFHLKIAQLSGNPFMRAASALIEAALMISFKLSSPAASPDTISEISNSHMEIVDRIAARDEAGAAEAMRNVIKAGEERNYTAVTP
jgi:DNA-binding FadR family transcriptional regulator